MSLRYLTIALLAAAILIACGQTSPQQPTATGGSNTPAANTPEMPAAPATAQLTHAPAATAAPTPPPPTAIPTQAPQPTQTPEPTSAPQPTSVPQPSATTKPSSSFGEELLFLRKGALIAFDMGTRKERQIADHVIDFVPAPDGRTIALVRDLGKGDVNNSGVDLWVVQRDGGTLTRLTKDGYDRIEATPSWSPDGTALAYAAADSSDLYARTWQEWSAWCVVSEVHVLDLRSGADQSFGPGCDPAISPDGKRIAYAAPPSIRQEDANTLNAANAIRLINRHGQNGWSFAIADGNSTGYAGTSGLLVYTPSWSPDGKQIVYHRFLGYHALVDLDLTEIGGSFEGKGTPLNDGAGWLLPARFAPNGQMVAIAENNFSDARGFGGYDSWSVSVLTLAGAHEIALPEGTLQAVGQKVGELPRAQAAAWAPDGATLAVLLPPGWNAQLSPNQPIDAGENPGEIWRWRPGDQPAEKLVEGVDFASPLAWLPAVAG